MSEQNLLSEQAAEEQSINLGNARTAADLKNLITRVRSIDKKAAVRLVARGRVLAVYVCTLAPETLLDSTPTVLGMRAMPLTQEAHLDVVVETSAVLDRLARIEEENFDLKIPPVTVTAVWSGVQPPMTGWEELAPVAAQELTRAAEEGMTAVEKALPQNPGHAVVSTVRSRIWASPLDANHPAGTRDYLPAGAAFAAVVLGFLPKQDDAPHRRFTSGDWTRLSLPAGYILVRKTRGA